MRNQITFFFDLVTLTLNLRVDLGVIHVRALTKFHGPRYNGSRDMNFDLVNFDLVTDRHTESDAYEPTVHTHRWAKKKNIVKLL